MLEQKAWNLRMSAHTALLSFAALPDGLRASPPRGFNVTQRSSRETCAHRTPHPTFNVNSPLNAEATRARSLLHASRSNTITITYLKERHFDVSR
jgi:hypothetical protein